MPREKRSAADSAATCTTGWGPCWAGLGLNLDAARTTLTADPSRAATYLGNAKEASTQVITSLRDVVHDLRPPALDELGLPGALRLQLDRIAGDAGLAVELDVGAELTLPAAVEVAAFRTIVEAVTNVVRHSNAGRVRIVVTSAIDRLTVSVDDDGTATPDWLPGIGLRNMRERAEELGGSFDIRAEPTIGTTIEARIPLHAAAFPLTTKMRT